MGNGARIFSVTKFSSTFVCQQCGYQSPSYLGKCPNCGSWNSFSEEVTQTEKKGASGQKKAGGAKQIRLSEVSAGKTERVSTGITELDLVLGGGIVPGMVVLVSGEPGIGKSTILLEIAKNFKGRVLYVAGEESAVQIKIRADRLGIKTENIDVLETTDVDEVALQIEEGLVIIDSIQTMTTSDLSGAAGSVGQVRECAVRLINRAKPIGVPLFIVGHVTKDGTIAGPKVLEHAVDTVLTIEGEKYQSLRLVRTSKNRFGPTDEVGVFQMTDKGLAPADPNYLTNLVNLETKPGACLTITMEGTRPVLVEVQALTTMTPMPMPRRVASGVDYNRLQTIVAILIKRLNVPLYKEDIYVSVSGGLRVLEPAVDLAIALAILSSYRGKALPEKSIAFGELDLLGNVRTINSIDRRIKEAKSLGFKNIFSLETVKNISEIKL